MLKILIKKQFDELLAGVFTNKRTGKKRSAGALVGYSLLLAFAAISLMFAFGSLYLLLGMTMKTGELQSGQAFEGWGGVYFAFSGIITAMIGLIGGMFSTYAVLYCPKDNEMLLSMPIKPMYILAARMMSVYILIIAYTFTSFLPALVIYWILNGFSFLVLLTGLVMYIAMTLLILAVSCLLGWLLA
ncbi:MAG: hypothetical protein IK056_01260, partial [Clostridia bacterium]|nr:hypothetical protein [Clostridia bacterium]